MKINKKDYSYRLSSFIIEYIELSNKYGFYGVNGGCGCGGFDPKEPGIEEFDNKKFKFSLIEDTLSNINSYGVFDLKRKTK